MLATLGVEAATAAPGARRAAHAPAHADRPAQRAHQPPRQQQAVRQPRHQQAAYQVHRQRSAHGQPPAQRTQPRKQAHQSPPRQPEAPSAAPATQAAAPAPGTAQGVERVIAALHRAGVATGARTELLLAIARRESGLDPLAASQGSSAYGLMQFTRDTWLEALRAFGARHGQAEMAAALAAGRPGAEAEALRLREDPELSAALAAERLEAWRQEIESTPGRKAMPADLYLVHLLGLTGARHFLKEYRRHPRWSAVTAFPAAAQANPGIFRDGRRPLSLAEVHRNLARSLTPQPTRSQEVAQAW